MLKNTKNLIDSFKEINKESMDKKKKEIRSLDWPK